MQLVSVLALMSSTRKAIIRCSICLFLSLPAGMLAQVAFGSSLTWRCSKRDGQTQMDVTLAHHVSYHYFLLHHPDRLVVDFSGLSLGAVPAHLPRVCGAIRRIRRAEHKGPLLRYVFLLPAGVAARIVPSRPAHGGTFRLSVRVGQRSARDEPVTPTDAGTSGRKGTLQAVMRLRRGDGPIIIAIDPGHGGIDPGTHGSHGLDEKTVTLAIGKLLAAKIDATPGLKAFLTRRRDRYVALRQRVLEAQRHHARLFISIHANSYPQLPRIEGAAVYALSEHGASSAEAELLARTENAADPAIGNVKFAPHNRLINSALTQLEQRASIQAGTHLGTDVLKSLSRYEPLYERRVQFANFEVLRDPVIPSILVETAFLSNPAQARDLHTRRFRAELASAIYHGILRYLRGHNLKPIRVVQARSSDGTGGAPRGHHRVTRRPVRAYRVKRGDTLSALAVRFHVRQWRLQAYNHLRKSRLRVGEVLRVPPPSFTYRVHAGDSLSVIAEKAGVSTRALRSYNDLAGTRLRAGQMLFLPPANHP